MGLAIGRRTSTKFRVLSTLMMVFALVAQPLYGLVTVQVANAAAPDLFPSTNASNKAAGNPYVEEVSKTSSSVTLLFTNPRSQTVYFEQRIDNAASTSTSQHGPCRVGNPNLPSGCQGKRYLEENDRSYASTSVTGGISREVTFNAVNNVAIRSTFGPERRWDFDWTTFAVAQPLAIPTGLKSESQNGSDISNASTNQNYVRNSWAEVPGAIGYNYEFEKPGLPTYSTTTNNTFIQGQFHGSYSPDGEYKFRVSSISLQGAVSEWSNWSSVKYDTTPPAVEVTYPTQGATITASDNKITIKGNFSDSLSGANYIQTQLVYKGNDKGVVTKHGQIIDGVLAEFDATGLIDGAEYYVAVVATDVVGNVSVRKIVNFTLDTTAPDAPMLNVQTSAGQALVNDGFTNKYNIVAKWNMPNGNPANYIYTYWNNIDGNPYKSDSPYSVTRTGLQQSGAFTEGEGKHYIQVFAVDAVGNVSQGSNIFGITYDITPPTVESFTYDDNKPGEGATVRGVTTFNVKLNETNPAKMYVEYMEKDAGGTWRKMVGKEVKNSDLAQLTVDTTAYQNGEHQIKVSSIVDKAGNTGATKTYKFNVDNIPPVVTFISPSVATYGNNETVDIQGAVGDAKSYQLFIKGDPVDDNTGAFIGDGYEWDTTGLKSDSYEIKVVAQDAVGNIATKSISVDIDNTPPSTIVANTNADTISGSVNENVQVTVLIRNSTNTTTLRTLTATPVATSSPSVFTWSVATPLTLPNGTYTVRALAKDSLGNESSSSNLNTRSLTIDRVINTEQILPLAPEDLLNANLATPLTTTFASTFGGASGSDSTAATAPIAQEEILGAQTEKQTAALPIEATESGWKIFGLAWYWWLLILAALVAAWWFIAGYRKRNAEA